MFPSLLIGGTTYYMTWIGMFLFLVFFVWRVRAVTKTYRLPFSLFTRKVVLLILIVYLCATYTWYLIQQRVIIPFHVDQLLLYLSPAWYRFHIVGLLGGAVLAWFYFKKFVKNTKQRAQWMFIFVKSALIATIPLWIFLVLGDNVIGMATDSRLGVSALSRESNVATYGRVLPLWLFISIWAALCLRWMHKRLPKDTPWKWSYLVIAIALFGLNILILFEVYPRFLVIKFWMFTLDFKNYMLLAWTIWALRLQLLLLAPTKSSHETDVYDER